MNYDLFTTQYAPLEVKKGRNSGVQVKITGNNPKVTAKDIASVCGITEDGVAYHIKKLKQSDRIIRIGGSRNGGEWKIIK